MSPKKSGTTTKAKGTDKVKVKKDDTSTAPPQKPKETKPTAEPPPKWPSDWAPEVIKYLDAQGYGPDRVLAVKDWGDFWKVITADGKKHIVPKLRP